MVTFQCEEINFGRYYLVVSKLVLGSVGSPGQPSKAETISGCLEAEIIFVTNYICGKNCLGEEFWEILLQFTSFQVEKN